MINVDEKINLQFLKIIYLLLPLEEKVTVVVWFCYCLAVHPYIGTPFIRYIIVRVDYKGGFYSY